MTLKQTKQEYPNFRQFKQTICDNCTSNDWYCTGLCDELLKADDLFSTPTIIKADKQKVRIRNDT